LIEIEIEIRYITMTIFVHSGAPERGEMPLRQRRPRAAVVTEFGAALDALGVTQRRAAQWFGVDPRSVRRWQRGSRHVPAGVGIVLRLLAMQAVTVDQVEQATAVASNGRVKPESRTPLVALAPEPSVSARAEAATVADSSLAARVLALGPASCRWPYGDPGHAGFRFCGAVTEKGPYCADHYAQAHLAPRPQPAPVGGPRGHNGRTALPTLLPSAGFGEQRLADNQITTSSHSA